MKNLKQELLNEKQALLQRKAQTQLKLKAHFEETGQESSKLLKNVLITAGGALLGYQAFKLVMLPFKRGNKKAEGLEQAQKNHAQNKQNTPSNGILQLLKQQVVLTATQMAKEALVDWLDAYFKKGKK